MKWNKFFWNKFERKKNQNDFENYSFAIKKWFSWACATETEWEKNTEYKYKKNWAAEKRRRDVRFGDDVDDGGGGVVVSCCYSNT